MGSALRMGPGYFPTWLGGIMAAFGVVIILLSCIMELGSVKTVPWPFRPWLVLCGTLVVYAVMMEKEVGFVPSLRALVIACALAHKDVRWWESILLANFVPMFAVGLFVYI